MPNLVWQWLLAYGTLAVIAQHSQTVAVAMVVRSVADSIAETEAGELWKLAVDTGSKIEIDLEFEAE